MQPTAKFSAGDRVLVSNASEWPNDVTGKVWLDGFLQQRFTGPTFVYFVMFDEPQDDHSDDGPYLGGEVEEAALSLLE